MAREGGSPEARAAARKRLTYLMLFRIGVVTLLLAVALAAEIGAPEGTPSTVDQALLGLIALTYGVTIAFALALRAGADPQSSGRAQLGVDLVFISILVHLTGGADSAFVFMYLLSIVGAAYVLGRDALWMAGFAVVLYAVMIVTRRAGLLPFVDPATTPSLRAAARVVTLNSIAILATGALGARLAVELERAGERIRSQGARLRDLAALHQDVVRCLTSGLITLSVDGRIASYNVAAAEILGLSEDATGRLLIEIVPALGRVLVASERGPVRRDEVEHRRGAGRQVLGVSVSPLVDAHRRVVGRVVNFQDVTAVRDMEEQVRRSERLAAVGRLAAGIAHEIRNPLAAISGSIELLAQAPALATGAAAAGSSSDAELMAIVLRETKRLDSLINDLLQFARPRAPDLVRMDLAQATAEIVRVMENDRAVVGARVELDAAKPVWVDADPGHVRQVLWNLMRNAAEASPEGGAITVSVGADAEGAPKPWARLSVRDRGSGIAAEHRARIFEPFFSTKARGTGLGLATVHRIVEEHQGTIDVGDGDGGGTVVTVRLPLASQPN